MSVLPVIMAALLFQVTTLDEALEALDAGETRIPYDIGNEAAGRLGPGTMDDEAERLCKVARLAESHEALAAALKRVLRANPTAVRPLVRAVGRLPVVHRSTVTAGLKQPDPAWLPLVEDEEAAVAAGAIDLVAPVAEPAWARTTFTAWIGDGRHAAVAQLATALRGTRQPAALYAELVRLDEVPLRHVAAIGGLLEALAARDDKTADAAIAAARQGPGPSGVAVYGLAGVPFARFEEVRPLVAEAFEAAKGQDDASLLCSSMHAASAQFVPDVVATLPWLCTSHPSAQVRLEAVAALGRLGASDLRTINALLKCLGEGGTLGAVAHKALQDRSGKRLAGDLESWEAWRNRANLPADLSSGDEERLATERRAYAEVQARERRNAARTWGEPEKPAKPAKPAPAKPTPAPAKPTPRR